MPRATLQDYVKAIDLIRKMSAKPVGSETPIKITQFCGDHGVRDNLFRVLQELGAIEFVIGVKREGSIFAWTHRKAENESDSQLASRVMARISEISKKYYTKWTKDQKAQIPRKVTFKEQARGLTIKAGADGLQITTARPEVAAVFATATPQEEVEVAAPQEVQEVNITPAAQPTSRHSHLSLLLEGSLTKEELIQKLGVLLNDSTITSFKLEVQY